MDFLAFVQYNFAIFCMSQSEIEEETEQDFKFRQEGGDNFTKHLMAQEAESQEGRVTCSVFQLVYEKGESRTQFYGSNLIYSQLILKLYQF